MKPDKVTVFIIIVLVNGALMALCKIMSFYERTGDLPW
jgi:hypothetical protein